jgi:YesN/AraC family two-component response regulator
MYYCFDLNVLPQIKDFYTVTRNTVWKIIDHNNILIFINDGSCLIDYENEKYTLKAGDIFFIPANHAYSRYPIDNQMCTMTYIHFSLSNESIQLDLSEIVEKISNSKLEIDNQILDGEFYLSNQSAIYLQNRYSLNNHEKIFNLLNDIFLMSIRRQLMCGLQSSITLCNICSLLSQHTIENVSTNTSVDTNNKVPDNLKKAIRYIRSHYTEAISLDALASHCNVSKQQMIRYFKTAFNQTPIAYITEYKINHAKKLLFNQPQLSIGNISDELGFNNQHYFTKTFLKATGETPSRYRYRTTNYNKNNNDKFKNN